jgi:uncharacterized protein YutE (UPF0331/DUF86 family)
VRQILGELDTVLAELGRHRHLRAADFRAALANRWIVERGLTAASSLVFDAGDHILAETWSLWPESYEASLAALRDRGVLTQGTWEQVRGLGGLRNLLVHGYARVEVETLEAHLDRALAVLPRVAGEILAWVERA